MFTTGHVIGILGAGIAIILSCIGSIIGVARAGLMAGGVLSKDPTKFGNMLAIQLLPATQGLYGFIVAFFALLQMKIIGGSEIPAMSEGQGYAILAACLPVAIIGLISAIYQGKVVMAGMEMMVKQEKQLGRAMVMAVLVEIFAIFAFVVSLFSVLGIKIG